MSLKGKTFSETDIPRGLRARMTPERRAEWCAEQTARWRIVAHDPTTGEDYVAEELESRILGRLPLKARRVATTMLQTTTPAEREELLKAFEADGTLKNPFQAVP